MARLPALVRTFAEFDDRDLVTVEQFARVIREAGHLPTTKRGAGAAEMGSLEAAKLFIALNGSDSPKNAIEAIERFYDLPISSAPKILSKTDVRRYYPETHPNEIEDQIAAALEADKISESIFSAQVFGEVLARLFERAPDVMAFISENYPGDFSWKTFEYITISLTRPMSWVYMNINFLTPYYQCAASFGDGGSYKSIVRETTVSVRSVAICRISQALFPDLWTAELLSKLGGSL